MPTYYFLLNGKKMEKESSHLESVLNFAEHLELQPGETVEVIEDSAAGTRTLYKRGGQ